MGRHHFGLVWNFSLGFGLAVVWNLALAQPARLPIDSAIFLAASLIDAARVGQLDAAAPTQVRVASRAPKGQSACTSSGGGAYKPNGTRGQGERSISVRDASRSDKLVRALARSA